MVRIVRIAWDESLGPFPSHLSHRGEAWEINTPSDRQSLKNRRRRKPRPAADESKDGPTEEPPRRAA
jgi:hypothetical protein